MPSTKSVRLPRLPKLPGSFTVQTGVLHGLPKPVPPGTDSVPPAPPTFVGTTPEWRVYWWLTTHKIAFSFQSAVMGGRHYVGGQVVDFVVEDREPPLIINVQGTYWHQDKAKEMLAKIALLNLGYDVVYVKEIDVDERLDYTMREALRGIQLYSD